MISNKSLGTTLLILPSQYVFNMEYNTSRNAKGHMVRELRGGHLVHASSVAKEDILLVNAQVQLRYILGFQQVPSQISEVSEF